MSQSVEKDAGLTGATDDELVQELTRRGALPRCPCGRWKTYVGVWDEDGRTLRCHGCLRAVGKCRC
jgi:hypothetical protein